MASATISTRHAATGRGTDIERRHQGKRRRRFALVNELSASAIAVRFWMRAASGGSIDLSPDNALSRAGSSGSMLQSWGSFMFLFLLDKELFQSQSAAVDVALD